MIQNHAEFVSPDLKHKHVSKTVKKFQASVLTFDSMLESPETGQIKRAFIYNFTQIITDVVAPPPTQ